MIKLLSGTIHSGKMANGYVTVGEFDVYIKKMPLQTGIKELESNGLELISAKEYAELIILNPNAEPAKHGTYTSEGYVYYPNGDIVILKGSLNPILRHPKEASAEHEEGSRFFLHPRNIQRCEYDEEYVYAFTKKVNAYAQTIKKHASNDLEKALEEGALYVPSSENPTRFKLDKFNEYKITRFLYEDHTKNLGELLKKISKISVLHFALEPDQVKAMVKKTRMNLPFCQPMHIEKPRLGMHIAAGNTSMDDEYSFIMGVTSSTKKTFVKLNPVSEEKELEIPADEDDDINLDLKEIEDDKWID